MALKQETKEAIKANRKLFMSDVPEWQRFFEALSLNSRGVIAEDILNNLETLGLDNFLDYMNSLPDGMFMGATSIENLVIPSNIDEIGEKCFSLCSKLKSCKLEGDIKIIPKQCFSGDTNLEEIYLPDTVRKIDKDAFNPISQNVKIYKRKTGKPIKTFQSDIPFLQSHFVEIASEEA